MYLPALADHPHGRIVAVCGRTESTARDLAATWDIPSVFTDWREMIASGEIDAVIVASANDTHHDVTMAALDAGLHVLCEKPIALTSEQAWAMARRADESGLVTMTPFTYRYMPMFQEVHRLLETGFVGTPYHLNLRYFTEYARDPSYAWRFDREIAGSGVMGDLGSHWLYLAEWLLGPISTIGALTRAFVDREARPDGRPYEPAEDSVLMTVSFANGAIGTLQACAVSWEGTGFGQTHHLDLHGSDGTVYAFSDWDETQRVTALPAERPRHEAVVGIDDQSWQGARRDTVHNTYRDVFRNADAMTRAWVNAIAAGRQIDPDLSAGARVQTLIDVALDSAAGDGRHLPVPAP